MRNPRVNILALSMAASCLMLSTALQAAPLVSQVDQDTIRVVHTSGKPPFRRELIRESADPVRFAWYAERVGATPRAVYASESHRAPGKMLPATAMRISSDAAELTSFARFEETSERTDSSRRWSGAPGKGIYRKRR